jgi:hypothetical protein
VDSQEVTQRGAESGDSHGAHGGAHSVEKQPATAVPADPELAAVMAAWPTLPAALKAGILAMVAAAVK